jgi:ribosomal protein S12 methylthiotransferase accessory factor YcaO
MDVVALSDYAREAVESERPSVAARLKGLREQAAKMRAITEALERDVDQTARLLRQMDEMLGLAPQLSLETLDGELRGQKLQEVAVELLRRRGRGEIHYREWFELVRAAGFQVAGKDPLAAFLTQVSRAPSVESVRPRSGLYRLRGSA